MRQVAYVRNINQALKYIHGSAKYSLFYILITHLPKVFVPINNVPQLATAEICCELHEKAHKLVINIVFFKFD